MLRVRSEASNVVEVHDPPTEVELLRRELEETRSQLAERKVIDRAKGILMKSRGLSEEEAYRLLRKTAMDQNRRVAQVAESLVTAAGLLGG